ncbi:HPS6 [Mytilus coruscus]|uniref:HPS6 n=1 Tax=Mytilus coruscus TaxID=42192 RepID=A0A6J8ADV9_MYTCO|nr:HPS6 [Mytilus coruscus]
MSSSIFITERKEEYTSFLDFTDTKPMKLLKQCGTRWLSLEMCIKRLLQQCPALKSYFQSHPESEKPCHIMRCAEFLVNNEMWLYFAFLDFILPVLNDLNVMFQAGESMVVFFAHRNGLSPFKTTPRCPENQHDNERIAIGWTASEFLSDHEDLLPVVVNRFYSSVRQFNCIAVSTMIAKFPFKDMVLQTIAYINPEIKQNSPDQKSQLQDQASDYILSPKSDLPPYDKENTTLNQFWQSMAQRKVPSGQPSLNCSFNFRKVMLTIPHSDADTKRTFSMLKKIQTDSSDTLDSQDNTQPAKHQDKQLHKLLPLFEDVVEKKYGEIHKIWMTPGHIFITVKEGRQLFTFDNKSNNSFEKCLDSKELESPILDILVSATNYSLIFIVEESGYVQCWRYKTEGWTFLLTLDICNVNQTSVVSICLHPSQNALFWCEERKVEDRTIYCICKRQLPDDEEKLENREIGNPIVVMHNCPSCQLYPSISGLYIVVRNNLPLVSMVILWLSYSNKVIVGIGKQKTEVTDFSINQPIEFNKLAVKLAGCISKLKPTDHLVGIIYKIQDMNLSTVLKDGSIISLSESEGDKKKTQFMIDLKNVSDEWFEFQKVIGSLQDSKIMLYRKLEQGSRHEQIPVKSPDGSPIIGFCKLSIGTIWPAFYTDNNIYTIQWSSKEDKQTIDTLVKSGNFQTPAVHLALLEQRKSDEPSPEVYTDLSKLRQNHLMNQDKEPATKLAVLLEPYLKNYWELDGLQQAFLKQNSNLPELSCRGVEDEVLHTISPQTMMPMSARQSWLLILSNIYPQQVFKVLNTLMDFETHDDISTSQIQRWQCILANENTVSPVSSDVAVPLFEHLCRLMLLIQPQKLVQFVKLCQMINNQKVGVSAFIRKRQALQYYDRALDCLPPPKDSENPEKAVNAYVELLMASEKTHCENTALKMFIDHGHWKDSIELIKKYKENQTLYGNLYLTLFRAMSQKEVLSEYAEEMFLESPENSCFTQISSFLLPKDATSAKDVFVNSSCDIPMHAVRSSLLKYYTPKS